LILIITTGIDIIEPESKSYFLTHIHSKQCFEVVFTIVLVTTFLVSKVGNGRKSVGKMELLYRCVEEVVGLGEEKLLCLWPVYENAVQTRRP
jgi:hypothetical protein